MAGGRGVALLVLLLSCWRQAGLQPVNVTSGPTEVPPSSKGQEDMPGVFDEILVQEMLDPKRSSPAGNQSTSALSTQLFKDRNAGVDEDFQVGGAQSYQGLSDNSQFFVGSDDKTLNNGKKLKTDQYKKISIVDKILQNSGKASGHTFR